MENMVVGNRYCCKLKLKHLVFPMFGVRYNEYSPLSENIFVGV